MTARCQFPDETLPPWSHVYRVLVLYLLVCVSRSVFSCSAHAMRLTSVAEAEGGAGGEAASTDPGAESTAS